MEVINAIGRRKASVARVYLSKGTGTITVNGKDYKEYFSPSHIVGTISEALETVEVEKDFDVNVNVAGGGFKGQAEAIRLGLARALTEVNADFRAPLKAKKHLKRDARVVERKKFGKPKARKSFQFSKR